jgi:hypothetical protein
MPLKPLLLKTSVTVNPYTDGEGNRLYSLKIQTDAFELNVRPAGRGREVRAGPQFALGEGVRAHRTVSGFPGVLVCRR